MRSHPRRAAQAAIQGGSHGALPGLGARHGHGAGSRRGTTAARTKAVGAVAAAAAAANGEVENALGEGGTGAALGTLAD